MKVFLSGTSFRRAYGGPARSVSRLAIALAEVGLEIGVWAPDGSALTTEFLPESSAVQRLGGSEVEAMAEFGQPDLIHDNGIWMPHNHQLARLARTRGVPRMVSIRGMLEPWAMNHKKWKKRVAWHLYQQKDLQSAAILHATAEREAEHLAAYRLGVPVSVVPNGIEVPGEVELENGGTAEECKESGERREGNVQRSALNAECLTKKDEERRIENRALRVALFVGRIYPVKGLPMLVEAWGRVRPHGWRMKIVGPDEAGHRAEVEVLVKQLGLEVCFEFWGELEEAAKRAAFAEAELVIAPSHTENFGMVIGEALAHGLPVISTEGTPWKLLKTEGCGWWTSVSVDGIAAALKEATAKSHEELAAMGVRGRQVVTKRFAWEAIGKQFVEVYQKIVNR